MKVWVEYSRVCACGGRGEGEGASGVVEGPVDYG